MGATPLFFVAGALIVAKPKIGLWLLGATAARILIRYW